MSPPKTIELPLILKLDLYTSKDIKKKTPPLIISIHGGANWKKR